MNRIKTSNYIGSRKLLPIEKLQRKISFTEQLGTESVERSSKNYLTNRNEEESIFAKFNTPG